MQINIVDLVPIIIIFQSILFALVLISDRGSKKISNRYLSLFLLVLALQFTSILIESLGYKLSFISLSICIYGFAYGPLLYFYSHSLMYKSFLFKKEQLFHFLPLPILYVLIALEVSICSYVGSLIYISLIIYVSLAVKEILHYRKVIKETQSTVERVNLVWLEWTMILFCFTLVLDMIDQLVWSMDIVANISTIHLALLLLINWMFYKGLKQPQIFLGITKLDEKVFQEKKNITEEKKPTKKEQEEIDVLLKFMKDNAIYTNAELNINQLSEQIEIPSRQLSYLINAFLKKNFMAFVNDYRIQEAIKRFKHPEDNNETISEVMYDVGFNSKSSFNTLFKKQTGYTPSEYKKKYFNS